MFFKIYRSFRADNGIFDLVTSLTIFILLVAVLLATRFLYRIKEYSADAFAERLLGLSKYTGVFALLLTRKPNPHYKKLRVSYQAKLFKALHFHPSIQERLSVLQFHSLIKNELPSLLFVAGLVLGYISCYDLNLDGSLAAIIDGEITLGFLATTFNFNHMGKGRWRNLRSNKNYYQINT